jgi:hypothetical protein
MQLLDCVESLFVPEPVLTRPELSHLSRDWPRAITFRFSRRADQRRAPFTIEHGDGSIDELGAQVGTSIISRAAVP